MPMPLPDVAEAVFPSNRHRHVSLESAVQMGADNVVERSDRHEATLVHERQVLGVRVRVWCLAFGPHRDRASTLADRRQQPGDVAIGHSEFAGQ